mmetsp:Transcript_58252/g.112410  ORF Transcript_58252/g.112410 Transcript_58252/m.112410 type:complete len:226 (+) Transcript_58252:303-980(+)
MNSKTLTISSAPARMARRRPKELVALTGRSLQPASMERHWLSTDFIISRFSRSSVRLHWCAMPRKWRNSAGNISASSLSSSTRAVWARVFSTKSCTSRTLRTTSRTSATRSGTALLSRMASATSRPMLRRRLSLTSFSTARVLFFCRCVNIILCSCWTVSGLRRCNSAVIFLKVLATILFTRGWSVLSNRPRLTRIMHCDATSWTSCMTRMLMTGQAEPTWYLHA